MKQAQQTKLVHWTHRQEEADQRPLDLSIIKRLFAFTQPYAAKRNGLLVMVLLRALQFPALGFSIASILSGPVAARDWTGTLLGCGGLAALIVSSVVVLHFRTLWALQLGEAVTHDLRQVMLTRLLAQPLGFFHKQRVGSLISRLTSDLEAVRIGVKDVAFIGTVQLGSMIGAALIMLYYDWLMFLVLVGLVPLLAAVIRRFQSRLMHTYRASQESFSRVTAAVAESINGIRVIQSHARAERNSQVFREQIYDHAQINMDAARHAGVFLPLFELNGQLFLALLLVIGGYRTLHGAMPLEAMLQFFFLSNYVFNPIAVLGNQYNQALTAMAGAERVFALLDIEPSWSDSADATDIGAIKGRVELRDVSFAYDPARPVLHDINLLVEPGQSVALVGRTGSGKSTLLGLIAKFYLADAGSLLIDQHDVRDLRSHALRRQLGCVLQSNFLFSGTVLDNVRLGRPFATESEIIEAARDLGVVDMIEALPNGWNTPVGERGAGLSLGQRQIVCFIRAMLVNPRLVLLDEATSAVDAVAERRLQAALERLLVGRTSFIVAHRLSTIRKADVVLVLEDGRIIERGDHNTLLARDGAYRRLYREFVAAPSSLN